MIYETQGQQGPSLAPEMAPEPFALDAAAIEQRPIMDRLGKTKIGVGIAIAAASVALAAANAKETFARGGSDEAPSARPSGERNLASVSAEFDIKRVKPSPSKFRNSLPKRPIPAYKDTVVTRGYDDYGGVRQYYNSDWLVGLVGVESVQGTLNSITGGCQYNTLSRGVGRQSMRVRSGKKTLRVTSRVHDVEDFALTNNTGRSVEAAWSLNCAELARPDIQIQAAFRSRPKAKPKLVGQPVTVEPYRLAVGPYPPGGSAFDGKVLESKRRQSILRLPRAVRPKDIKEGLVCYRTTVTAYVQDSYDGQVITSTNPANQTSWTNCPKPKK